MGTFRTRFSSPALAFIAVMACLAAASVTQGADDKDSWRDHNSR